LYAAANCCPCDCLFDERADAERQGTQLMNCEEKQQTAAGSPQEIDLLYGWR
jgi:hypothetical protein